MFLQISSNVGYGVKSGFRLVRSFTPGGVCHLLGVVEMQKQSGV